MDSGTRRPAIDIAAPRERAGETGDDPGAPDEAAEEVAALTPSNADGENPYAAPMRTQPPSAPGVGSEGAQPKGRSPRKPAIGLFGLGRRGNDEQRAASGDGAPRQAEARRTAIAVAMPSPTGRPGTAPPPGHPKEESADDEVEVSVVPQHATAAIAVGRRAPAVTAAASAVRFRMPDRVLMQQIQSGEASAFEQLLELSVSEVLEGVWSDEATLERVGQFVQRIAKLEDANAALKAFRTDFPRYKQWREGLDRVRRANAPAAALAAEVGVERRYRGEAELTRLAGWVLRDGLLEWHEHQEMLQRAEEYGLGLADVRLAYRRVLPDWSDEREPRKPPGTWRQHPKLATGEGLWDLDDLLDTVLGRLDEAAKLLETDPEYKSSLIAYLESLAGDLARQTETAARDARKVRATLELDPRVGVLEFLWRMGRNELYLTNSLGLPARGAGRVTVRSIPELHEVALSHRHGTSLVGTLLETGALERWLELVGKHPAGSQEAARFRKALAGQTRADRERFVRGAVVTLFWSTGYQGFPLEGAGATATSLDELLAATDAGRGVLTDDMLSSGLLEAWLSRVAERPDLQELAREIASDGKGAKAERWRQAAGAKTFKIGGVEAGSVLSFSLLALVAARNKATVGATPPGARTLDDALREAAGNSAAFGEATDLDYSDIAEALELELPQRRFQRQSPELAAMLNRVSGMNVSPREKAEVACLMAGLRYLPLPEVDTAVRTVEELAAIVHADGVRSAALEHLRSDAFYAWIRSVLPAEPAGLHAFFVAKKELAGRAVGPELKSSRREVSKKRKSRGDGPVQLATVDAVLRYALQRTSCSLAVDLTIRSHEELRRLALDPQLFGYLADPLSRELIRDACGADGSLRLPGCPEDMVGPSEKQLVAFPPFMFAWYWVRAPVMWLGEYEVCVQTEMELLAALADEHQRDLVRAAAELGFVGAWLRHCAKRPLPDTISTDDTVTEGHFARFTAWIGDEIPAVELTAEPRLLVPEGSVAELRYSLKNPDPIREVEVVVEASAPDGLTILPARQVVVLTAGGAASVFEGRKRVISRPGVAGTLAISVQVFPRGPVAREPLAAMSVPCEVRFPWGGLLLNAFRWLAIAVVVAVLLRLGIGLLASESTLVARLQGPVTAPSDSGENALAIALFVGILLAYRAVFGATCEAFWPTAKSFRLALGVAFFGALALVPVASMGGGCYGLANGNMGAGCSLGATWGAIIAGVVGIFLLVRPGSMLDEPAYDGKAILNDAVVAMVCVVFLFLRGPVGQALVSLVDSLDGAGLLAVSNGSATANVALVGWAVLAGLMGLAFGAFLKLVGTSRPLVAWGVVIAVATAMGLWLNGRRDLLPSGGGVEAPSVDVASCRAAIVNAGEVLASKRMNGEDAASYLKSEAFAAEVETGIARCRERIPRPEEMQCVRDAKSVPALKKCDPFWL